MTELTIKTVKSSKLYSVFVKMSVLAGAVWLVLIVSLSYQSYRSNLLRLDENLRQMAEMTTPPLATRIAENLIYKQDYKTIKILQETTDSAEGRMIGAYAVDLKGEERSRIDDGADVALLKELALRAAKDGQIAVSDDGFYFASPTIPYEGAQQTGAVATGWTTAPDIAAVQRSALLDLLKIVGIFLALVSFAAFATHRLLTRPLQQVNTAVQHVAEGEYALTVPQMSRRDEIGAIARSLDAFREQLAQSETSIREGLFRGSAFESASACLILLDQDYRIKAVNRSMLDMLQTCLDDFRTIRADFDPNNLVGKSFDYFHPEGTATNTLVHEAQLPISREAPIGAGFYYISISGVQDDHGKPLGLAVEWKNITEAKRNAAVTEAIDATQLRAEFLPDGRVTEANMALCMMFDTSREDLLGRDLSQAIVRPDTGESCFESLQRGESVIGRMALDFGATRYLLSGALAPVRNAAGTIQRIVMIASDMTDIEAREARNRAERERTESAQRAVVDALRAALAALAEGDLSRAISEAFPEEYETLRLDYNQAMARLRQAMQAVVENSDSIRTESTSISNAATDLSRRTEQQAATLEQTAAALNQLTVSVKSAAERTQEANALVSSARQNAETSGKVVYEAVQAMGEIAESSNKISRITSVIEEISFQTNLLALNAGVEAARAGEAGRGFAVVASEVRALAQRSSDAAREIAGLISASSEQVKRGVNLVDQAGNALGGIRSSVAEIVDFMSEIAASTTEQSAGLSEVNAAMLQLDQVTQHNAAMFEQTSAASQSLVREADTLSDTMSRFQLGAASQVDTESNGFRSSRAPAAPAGAPKIAPPAAAPVPYVPRSASRLSALAIKAEPDEDDWEDF